MKKISDAPLIHYETMEIQPLLDNQAGDIYQQFSAFLAQRFGLNKIVSITFEPPNSFITSLDINKSVPLVPDISILLDHPESPAWDMLAHVMDIAPAAVLVKPFQVFKMMPADERQRQIDDFSRILTNHGLQVDLAGWVRQERGLPSLVAILANNHPAFQKAAPPNFRVVALMSTYNEADIIAPVLERLIQDGIQVFLLENESTDGTYEIAQAYLGKGLIGLERFSPKNPAELWTEILQRKEDLAQELDADWFMHHDADEIRESPWPNVNLRDAFFRVEQQGFNCIDFTVLEFCPVDNTYISGENLETSFPFFTFGKHSAVFLEIKAWKKNRQRVSLLELGGHKVNFPEARVYPYKFLMRHYPIRSQEQGERKIFVERKIKFAGEKESKGWHAHYDHLRKGDNLLGKKDDLVYFDEKFYSDYLFERISGLGILPTNYDQKIRKMTVQVAEKEQAMQALTVQVAEKEQAVQALTVQVAEKEQAVQVLMAKVAEGEQDLAEITGSKAWKIALLFRRIRVLLAPPNSHRDRELRRFMNGSLLEKIRRNRKLKQDLVLIRSSGFFDEAWYLEQNPDVTQSGVNPARHYLLYGGFEGRDPGLNFSSAWYLKTYENVKNAGMNPLVHYLKNGREEGYQPNPEVGDVELIRSSGLFDPNWYLANNPDVAQAKADPLLHFLHDGGFEGRNPDPDFSSAWYLDTYPDVKKAGINPLVHYLKHGRDEGRQPSLEDFDIALIKSSDLYDEDWYLANNPDVAQTKADPLLHFLHNGGFEGRDPGPKFSSAWYLAKYKDVKNAGINPLVHYLKHGRGERRVINSNLEFEAINCLDDRYDAIPINIPENIESSSKLLYKLQQNLMNEDCIISISHDNYLNNTGGVQICIAEEQRISNCNGTDYLHFYPYTNKPTLARDNEPFFIGINCNGINLGATDGERMLEALEQLQSKRIMNIFIHHTMGFNINFIYRLLKTIGKNRGRFWLHDFFSICPSYFLLRNDVEFCGAPVIDSNACSICLYEEMRRKQQSAFLKLFNENNLEVWAPSSFTLALWKEKFPNNGVPGIINPHAELKWTGKIPSRNIKEPMRIGFLGISAYHKGWQTWVKLIKLNLNNERYKFYVFSSEDISGNYERINVSVTAENRLAMVEALKNNKIDIAILWSLCPETFSFTLYESLAAGCYIITNKDSGNIQDYVKRNTDQGLVLENEQELFSLFSSNVLYSYLSNFQKEGKPQGELIFSAGLE